jgi:VWFA-related protein
VSRSVPRAAAWTLAIVAGAVALGAARQPPQSTFRAAVDAVTIDVSVFQGNSAVSGLTAADFILTDNGVKQELAASVVETWPIDLTLVLDASGSVQNQFQQLRADVSAIASMLKATDQLRLLAFGTIVSAPFGIQAGGTAPAVETIAPAGGTSFYHALVSALIVSQPGPAVDRRQLIVAVTDGVDTTSFLDASDIRIAAARAAAILHLFIVPSSAALARSSGWVPYFGPSDVKALTQAVQDTGGRLREGAKSVPDLVRVVLAEFRTSYVLRYTATGVPAGGWHDVAVQIAKPGTFTVRAKKGYFAGPGRP